MIGSIGVKKNGFTLIELMITVAIVAILVSIAYPAYSSFVQKSNRTDATQSMSFTAQQLERCYSQGFNFTLCQAPPYNVPAALTSSQGFYTVTVTILSATTYQVVATPLRAPQLGDFSCQQFMLTNNVQSATNGGGGVTTSTCWGSS
jgi:type IV pilus assembly protein PilE